jgi:rhamnose transport system permease protein
VSTEARDSELGTPGTRPKMRFAWWHEAVLAALLIGLLLLASSLMPNFLQWKSQLLLSRQLWEFAILALGMTLVMISGGIDLSVGSTMGLCAVVFGLVFSATQSVTLSCLACLATGTVGGAINGLLISRTQIHPLLITLATYAAYRGMAEGISQGAAYSQFGQAFSNLARGTWLHVPLPGFVFVVLAASFALLLTSTPAGRFIYAMGHNETAARFSGIAVDRLKCWLYITTGSLAGLATVIYVSRFDTAKADAGKGFELDVITAVVVGGTSVFGGRGNIGGTILGLLLIHETRLFVSRYWRTDELRSIVIGFLLITSVLIYRAVLREKKD